MKSATKQSEDQNQQRKTTNDKQKMILPEMRVSSDSGGTIGPL
jgi:hypothetical protein